MFCEIAYSHSRRKHAHRCQCCSKIVQDGQQVLMYSCGNVTRVLHLSCADKPSFDGITMRELAELHSGVRNGRTG
jgi:hypothetical protein